MKIVITGASSGIGRALSENILKYKEKAKVVGVGRNSEALRELKSVYGERFEYVIADLTDMSDVYRVVNSVVDFLGTVDVLVNNAGFGVYKELLNHSDEDIYNLLKVNFIAPIILSRELVKYMNRGSVIVNVLTAGIYVLMRKLPIYGASKFGLHYVTNVMRHELKDKGIKVISVFPGIINTEFHKRAGINYIRGGASADSVAKAIIKAIERGGKEVYVPGYLRILKILGPKLIPFT
ncbi:MAG: SDR family NAD(P)-dependent oxidoreductase [Sulfolobales archaeon]|nr:SDR family NAD(P)-dependent oxidoreductase [Sulfolobales archaeon]MCX8186730.1 SDR family NAD(P)-dependent oxidoreductase [Sulfolobales archaeon]MDW7969697.1 SDR family NAD(P)-dependent oxidoreductase [Sulfolobales archaeon]